jgi:hypothetical protein
MGWLDGLFQGIHTALAAQQMAAQARQGDSGTQRVPPGILARAARAMAPEFGLGNDSRKVPGQYL